MQRWDLLAIDAPQGTRDPVVVAQDEGARAVLVVLSPGQELGEHQVKENAWVAIVEGTVRVTADGESVDVGAGALLRFEPAERHSFSSEGGARILMVLTPWPGAPEIVGRSNRDTIERLGDVQVATLPYIERPEAALLARAGRSLPVDDWLRSPVAVSDRGGS